MNVKEIIDNAAEEAIAQGDRWAFANATAFQRQGINVYRSNGLYDGQKETRMEWWVRCEEPYEPIKYRLAYTYIL